MKVSADQVKKNVDIITLADMAVSIDVDQVMLDDYPSAERDFALYLVQGYYLRYLQKLEADSDGTPVEMHLRLRALDYSKWFTSHRLTGEMHSLIDRATMFILDDAEQTGWYRGDHFGYNNLEELLASTADEQQEHSSSWYDWAFIVKTLVPFAKSMGIDPGDFHSASLQIRKLRAIVPATRDVLSAWDNNRITGDEAKKTVEWMIKQVANPRVSTRSLTEEINKIRGIQVNRMEEIKGNQYILPGNRTWILIPCKNAVQVRAVEMALKNIADIDLGHLDDLLTSITAILTKITDEEVERLYEPIQSVPSSR